MIPILYPSIKHSPEESAKERYLHLSVKGRQRLKATWLGTPRLWYIGIMEKKMETTSTKGVIWEEWKRTWKLLLIIKRFHRDNGKENGVYYLGFRV